MAASSTRRRGLPALPAAALALTLVIATLTTSTARASSYDPFAIDLSSFPEAAAYFNASSRAADGLHSTRGRHLQFLDTSSIYKYCWRDTYLRTPTRQALFCPFGEDKVEKNCVDKCKEGFKPAGPLCVHDCSAYGGGWTNCGMGCAPDTKSCLKKVMDQFSNSVSWVTNTVIPGARAFNGQLAALGAPAASGLGAVKGLGKLSGELAFIAEKTYEKRSLVAMLTAKLAKPLVKSGGIVGFFAPSASSADNIAKFREFRKRNKVPIDLTRRSASTILKSITEAKVSLNVEDMAKFDPTGTMPVLLAFSHPVCSNNLCAKCNVTSNPCEAGAECKNGKCGKTLYEPDGTPCVESDYQSNTFPGFCQTGSCKTGGTQAYYTAGQEASMWLPEGLRVPTLDALKVRVQSGVSKNGKGFVAKSLNFWHDLSRQSRSCTFNNGGCGAFACRVDFKKKSTRCVDPKRFGFKAAPIGINFPRGKTLKYSFPTSAPKCMEACNQVKECVLAVTTVGRECWLKSSIGNAISSLSFQAYKKG